MNIRNVCTRSKIRDTKNSENSLNASHIAIDRALREAAFIILGVDVILLSKQQVPNPYEHEFRALPAVY